MFIQTNVPRNPYAAWALMTRQGALGTAESQGLFPVDRAPLARRPLPGLAHSAPVLRSQLLARVERYEGLGEQISTLRTALNQFVSTTTRGASLASGLGKASLGLPHDSARSSTPASERSASGNSGASGSTGGPSPGTGTPVTGGGSAPSTGSSGPRLVSDPAVLLGSERISLTPATPGTAGKPGTRATLITDPLELRGNLATFAELKGDTIVLGDDNGHTRFGKMILNGQTINFSPFKGDSTTEAAQFIAARINEFQAKTGVVALVDPETGDRLILRSKVPGTGTISISELEVKKKNPGWTGFQEGDFARGETGASNLGEVTINGITTQFGTRKHASTLEALSFMASRLNEDHKDLEATVEGNRLVLTSKATGADALIRVDSATFGALKQTPSDSSNGFKAGTWARGSDAVAATPDDPGVTDFGAVTINGISTVFGVLDNRAHDAASAAQFLAQRINETNSTVRASIEDGRLKLISTQQGSGATIRIDALDADSDGNRDNDRALGFVLGARASGSETTVPSGGSGSGGSGATGSTGSSGASGAGPAGSSQGRAGTENETAGLTETEASDLSDQLKEWTRLTNNYLTALDKRSAEHAQGPGELKAFSRTIASMMKQDDTITGMGVTVEGGRISLDEARFMQALAADPESTLGAVQQFRDTLDPLLASQAYAMDFLREVAAATRDQVPAISQAKSMQFKLEQRSKEVALYLETLEKLLPDLSEQGDRLSKLAAPDDADALKKDEEARPDPWKRDPAEEDKRKPKPWEPETPRGLAAIGHLPEAPRSVNPLQSFM